MANRYWVGGAGTWNTTSTTKWSANDGGSSGASVPTAADSVFFTASSGTPGNVTMTGALACLDINVQVTGWSFITGTGPTLAVSGSMTLTSGTTWSSTGAITFNSTAIPSQGITSAGTTFACNFTFNGVGGTWTLQDALTTGATNTTTLTNGTLSLFNYTLTTGLFASNNSNTRTIDFSSGNITLSAATAVTAWTTATVTNLTVSGTPVVNTTGGGANTKTINTGALSQANSISFSLKNSAGTVAFTASNVVKNLTLNGAFTLSNIAITLYGDYTYTASTTLTAGTNAWTFASTGSQTITGNGATLDFPVTFNGAGGTWTLGSALTVGSTRLTTLTNGTVSLAGYTFTTGTFATATGTKNITFNGGTLTVSGSGATAFNNAQPTNFTTTAGTGTGTISMTSASAKTFVGGGSTYNCTINQGGAGALTITGSNTFDNITNTTQPVTVSFTAGTTSTFTSGFSLSGTAGNLVTIGSATAASHTLSKASGIVDVSYCSISRSTATGGATWLALP